jgi:uncharacterized membrane protein
LLPFALGAAGSILGAALASSVAVALRLCSRTSAAGLAAVFAATYVGGALNYVAVGKAVGLGDVYMAAGLAADLVAMAMYFGGLFWIGAVDNAKNRVSSTRLDEVGPGSRSIPGVQVDVLVTGHAQTTALPIRDCQFLSTLSHLAIAAFPALLALSLHYLGVLLFSVHPLCSLHGTSALSLLFSTGFASLLSRQSVLTPFLSSAPRLAEGALLLFFAALGAATRLADIAAAGPAALFVAAVALGVHALVLWIAAKVVFGVPPRECLVASNANVGGPTTAAAYAAALGWRALVAPGVAAGLLGYLVATPLGLVLHSILLNVL